ncbi:MAG: type II toxin-antitoxin system HicA family toxin [Betaproteobacteria bacterium]|nr:type II toxin-antitoxin system HicA family toxin [Betaproteobacteria bacterium]
MNSKHRKTLEAVFSKPTPGALEWLRIEALLIAAGCKLVEGRGSRVRFVHGEAIATFHRPHPAKEAKPYQVEDARDFLRLIGVTP